MKNSENQDVERNSSRWLRVGVLTLTMVGPVVNYLSEWLRHRSESLRQRGGEVQEAARSAQSTALHHLDEFTLEGRHLAVEQAKQLRKQAHELQAQARQLRKALRDEARQRHEVQKLLNQLREVGGEWSQELMKRGEVLSEELLEQGGKISHNLLERGGKVTHDLTERGGLLTQELVRRGSDLSQDVAKRGGQVTHEIVKQGSKVTQNLAERRETLLHPERKRTSAFWTIFGFCFGLVAAAIFTYVFVRRRVLHQEIDESEHIELPHNGNWNGTSNNTPAGEIRHLDADEHLVASSQAVDIEQENEALHDVPTNAQFVGVISTKRYYPLETPLDTTDLIYFASAEEAQQQAFSAAE